MMTGYRTTAKLAQSAERAGCICHFNGEVGSETMWRTQKMGCPVHDAQADPQPEPVRDLRDDIQDQTDPRRTLSAPDHPAGGGVGQISGRAVTGLSDRMVSPFAVTVRGVADASKAILAARADVSPAERAFAVAMPNRRAVAVHFDAGHVEFSEREADHIVNTLSGALAILRGETAVQQEVRP